MEVGKQPRFVISDAQPKCSVFTSTRLEAQVLFSFFFCKSLYPNQALIFLSFSQPYNYSHDVFSKAFRETVPCLYLIPSLWVFGSFVFIGITGP